MSISVLIPAYRPTERLVELVEQLAQQSFNTIVVVDDGSGPNHEQYFQAVRHHRNVHVLRHAVNLGKGAALKTGLNYLACTYPMHVGVVTADADGQHLAPDIIEIAAQLQASPNSLIIGARGFDGPVPFRSRVGNTLTRYLVKVLVGCSLQDTQSGLRGIPARMIPDLLRVKSSGYEFELDMILLSRNLGVPISETTIQTVYIAGNQSSHFNPLSDSMKIYFVLFRFAASSISTTALDFVIFTRVFWMSHSIVASLVAARIIAVNVNYLLVKTAVFNSRDRYTKTFPKYLALTAFSGTMTYLLIRLITSRLPVGVVAAKACAETVIFFLNFAIQREFIFPPPITETSK